MDGPTDDYTKWSQSERERQILYDITHVWNLKYATNEVIYETEADNENRLVLAKGESEQERRTGSLGLACSNYFI